jgi:hypothetical protein
MAAHMGDRYLEALETHEASVSRNMGWTPRKI